MNAHGSRACHCLTRARAFAAKLKEAHALLEAERLEAIGTKQAPAVSATFANPLDEDDAGGGDEDAAAGDNDARSGDNST